MNTSTKVPWALPFRSLEPTKVVVLDSLLHASSAIIHRGSFCTFVVPNDYVYTHDLRGLKYWYAGEMFSNSAHLNVKYEDLIVWLCGRDIIRPRAKKTRQTSLKNGSSSSWR